MRDGASILVQVNVVVLWGVMIPGSLQLLHIISCAVLVLMGQGGCWNSSHHARFQSRKQAASYFPGRKGAKIYCDHVCARQLTYIILFNVSITIWCIIIFIFFCYTKNEHKLYSFKQHKFIISWFHGSGVRVWIGWVFCPGSHQAEGTCWWGCDSHLSLWVMQAPGCWYRWFPCGCMTDTPLFLLATIQRLHSPPRGHL